MNQNSDERSFWETRWKEQQTGWDMGMVSPPLKAYIDQLTDKNIRILIPGCGSAYEAEYLAINGFSNVTVIDISPTLTATLAEKFKSHGLSIQVINQDFFELDGTYDLILEQTFFCAIPRSMREQYVEKCHALLSTNGKIAGVLFGVEFDKPGPPHGGNPETYKQQFSPYFKLNTFSPCYNSHPKRAGNELFVILQKQP